jgi:hypothetical protein
MIISTQYLKTAAICLALGHGVKESDLISDMWLDGYSMLMIDKIIYDAKVMLFAIELDIDLIMKNDKIIECEVVS